MDQIRSGAAVKVGLHTFVLAGILGLFSISCTSQVPATVTMHPIGLIDAKEPIYVIASTQRDRIVESLRKAGLKPSNKPGPGGYALNVKLGGSRASMDCGTLRNVAYVMTAGSARIVVLKGRGHTGTCDPNILDDMSALLASLAHQ